MPDNDNEAIALQGRWQTTDADAKNDRAVEVIPVYRPSYEEEDPGFQVACAVQAEIARSESRRCRTLRAAARRISRTPEKSAARHARKCTICNHPEREAIEEEFLHWHHPDGIAAAYELGSERAVYRHAHAVGIYEQRRVNLCAALDHIVENAENASVTADSVIRAIRAYSRLTPKGQWIEPPAQVVFSVARPGIPGLADQSQVPKSNLQLPDSNRHPCRLETELND